MRKLILYTAVSIDGYIATPEGGINWLPTDKNEDYGFSSFESQVDEAILGFNTYDKVKDFPGNPFGRVKHYVITTKEETPEDVRVVFINQELRTFLSMLLTKENKKNVWLMGGGELIRSVLQAGINIDDWMLFVIPIILGEGIPLFPPSFPEQELTLRESFAYSNGVVKLRYSSK